MRFRLVFGVLALWLAFLGTLGRGVQAQVWPPPLPDGWPDTVYVRVPMGDFALSWSSTELFHEGTYVTHFDFDDRSYVASFKMTNAYGSPMADFSDGVGVMTVQDVTGTVLGADKYSALFNGWELSFLTYDYLGWGSSVEVSRSDFRVGVAVPEPAALGMVAAGSSLMLFRRRHGSLSRSC